MTALKDMPSELNGRVTSIIYQNSDGFSIASIYDKSLDDHITIKGAMPGLAEGQIVSVSGTWENNKTHGMQMTVNSFVQKMPTTKDGILEYLMMGNIKGIGPVYAQRIVDKFGTNTWKMFDTDSKRLAEIKGISPKMADKIAESWKESSESRKVIAWLNKFGITSGHAMRIFNAFKKDTQKRLMDDPFCMVREVHGIGFRIADDIARKMDIKEDDPRRIQAAISFVLSESEREGHVFLPYDNLIKRCEEELKLSAKLIGEAIVRLIHTKQLYNYADRVYQYTMYEAERFIEEWFKSHLRFKLPEISSSMASVRSDYFSKEQLQAIELSLNSPMMILTGGPGTGKTTTEKGMIEALQGAGLADIKLAAPTGKAAKRMEQTTGMESSTVHRLLGSNRGGGFTHDQYNPLECDVLILDEFSMMDTRLLYYLLRALPHSVRLIIIGDEDQLPSVGPGNVLHDLIYSGVVPYVRLTEIFRQAAKSRIVTNAHLINQGMPIVVDNTTESDLFVIYADDTKLNKMATRIVDIVSRRLPVKYGLDPVNDIQVVSPMYKTPVGVHGLNEALQKCLLPSLKVKEHLGIHVGDKILQLRNNRDLDIYNGDIGIVQDVDRYDQKYTVDFDGHIVDIDFSKRMDITLAYATSVHKSQGSEFPAVVMPLVSSHYIMLQRNLLYTAVTRAKSKMILITSKKALNIAIRNNKVKQRFTSLFKKAEELEF